MSLINLISKKNLKKIFAFLGFPYFLLLKQVNKEWKQIIENEIEIENTNIQKNQRYFYSLVNDFLSRKDFEELNIRFLFQNNDLFENFSEFGFLNGVKYLHEKNPITKKMERKDQKKIIWDEESCANASLNGDLHILKYLHENKCPWNERSCIFASLNGYLDILKYLHKNKCPWNEWCCSNAAFKGHLHILKYLHENKCPWDEKSCMFASRNGHLHILKYLHENECPWNKECCMYASLKGHLDILKYLHENKCPWDETCCEIALFNGHLDILKYLHENKCPWNKWRIYAKFIF